MKTRRSQPGKTLTPWGFYLEDVFELFANRAEQDVFVEQMKARRKELPYGVKPCAYPHCGEAQKKPGAKLCKRHSDRLRELEDRKWEEARRAEELANLERREYARERAAVRKIVAQARREYAAERAARQPKRRYTGPTRPGYVYRLFDESGALLYVGKTYNVGARFYTGPGAHSLTKAWFAKVALAKIAAYKTEADALEAEAWAIKREAPLHNVATPTPKKSRAPRPVAVYEGAL